MPEEGKSQSTSLRKQHSLSNQGESNSESQPIKGKEQLPLVENAKDLLIEKIRNTRPIDRQHTEEGSGNWEMRVPD